MGNSVSSPGGKAIAIAGGAVVLALGASYLWDFLSNDDDHLSSISTKKSSASASSTPDAPASRIRNKLAEEVLTDPRNRDGFANGSEEDLSSKSTKKSSASASSTRDAPASGRTKLAEEASVTLRPVGQLSKLPVKVLGLEHCKDSIMKKKLIVAEVEALGKRRSLVVANGHLKRPNLPDESHTNKRTAQAKEAITILGNYNNAIFGGDMNWSEDLDGCFPLPNGWVDAWERLRPFENGWTYDNVSNQMMIKGKRRLRKRLDRFLCKLKDYKLACIEIIGKDIIPGLRHQHREKDYPVLCSDHFGLLLRISI
ncbi:hypothetical protein ZIOFF_023910 [Zingiber officinale]|uniref:Uncharacterized protein n=1 Tax=Zingiber officinale TaxID=94328 RepID=A0A8J5GSR3_ZINOF|nr:hypothetical protein ZIOFF_023910 [Zingiber officinale]